MAKKSPTKAAKRSTSKRELLTPGTSSRYARRDAEGKWTEMDDVGRSQRADKARVATTSVQPGYGDLGDQPKSRTKRAAKKR